MNRFINGTSEVHTSIDTIPLAEYGCLVPLYTDTADALKHKLASECQRVQEIRREKIALAEQYNRYMRLQGELRGHEKTIDRLMAILGDLLVGDAREQFLVIDEVIEIHVPLEQLRDEIPLWEIVAEFLGIVGEARISEVTLFLRWIAMDISREAVESALRVHPDVFAIRKDGRDKYLSLRERSIHAPATKTKRK